MTQVKFRVAAYTDAAGRYNPDAPRNGNEDNMFVNADLGAPEGSAFFESDKETTLSDYGCLLVVADGMGGMNAGEVASEIAVNVVKDAFAKETVPHSAMESAEGREKYLKKVVVLADEAVKRHANAHPECEGMGSTLVMAWIKDGEASIAWLGDSRIYLFREPEGLRQVSKDHSYVQELVDAGKITEEEAFIHPYNNVITRSLGDTSKKAEADSSTFKLFKGDILLLNSDGLSGVLHDDEMGQIIRANRETMGACRLALWKAAEEAEWHDNVTAVLCEITEGEEYVEPKVSTTADPDAKPVPALQEPEKDEKQEKPIAVKKGTKKPNLKQLIPLVVIALLAVVLLLFLLPRFSVKGVKEVEEAIDTTKVEVPIQTPESSVATNDTGSSPKSLNEPNRSESPRDGKLPVQRKNESAKIATPQSQSVPETAEKKKEPTQQSQSKLVPAGSASQDDTEAERKKEGAIEKEGNQEEPR